MKNWTVMLAAILSVISFAQASDDSFCANPLAGKWTCDTDIFGTNIEILVAPPGNGLTSGIVIVIDSDKDDTVLTAPLTDAWTSGEDFYPVKAACLADSANVVDVDFKDRPVNFQKASGSFGFRFEPSPLNPKQSELHIYDNVNFHGGGTYTLNATCVSKR